MERNQFLNQIMPGVSVKVRSILLLRNSLVVSDRVFFKSFYYDNKKCKPCSD